MMMNEQLAPILSQAEHHPEHGGVMANDAIANYFEVSENSIRTLKKRLIDESAIEQDRHWLTGENNKTLWTFRGFLRLGMRLSSAKALAVQSMIEELLTMLNDGQLQIVPVEGQAIGVQLLHVETPETAIAPYPICTDETALGNALGVAKYEQEQQQQAESLERIKSAAIARYQELKQGESDLGELLAQALGLPSEMVSNIMGEVTA